MAETNGSEADRIDRDSFIQAVREVATESLEERTSQSVAELEADSIARLAWYRALTVQKKTESAGPGHN
ncbi:MAG: hypothetical protein ISR51_04765 [Rhodospirillales bacterium]|nr:hypothetical protein [Alphaproteobacteria bacterium]MBL6947968.1 hypothetical protein [Rhodospirillales bacterium]